MKKENKPASTYANPHTMSGADVKATPSKGKWAAQDMDEMRISIGTIVKGDKPVKTSGIKTRGNGAATKGVMARGPMG